MKPVVTWIEQAKVNTKKADIYNLLLAVDMLLEFAGEIRDDWDCDRDAHRYGTPCRVCTANEVIEKVTSLKA